MRRFIGRHGYWIAVTTLSVAIVLLSAAIIIGIGLPELERAMVVSPTRTPEQNASSTAEPTAEPTAGPLLMGGAIVPADARCAGCHSMTTGTIGTIAIPVMAHPVEGWSRCADCHAPARLVDTAPGHSGIHATECIICHKAGDLPAPLSRPHRDNQNVACLSCHGTTAPLPSDMTHRKETVCWLCHRLPTVEPPIPAHQTAPGEADCLTCHRSGGRAGALPVDHVARSATLCLSCHEVVLGPTASTPPRISVWPAPSGTAAPLPTPVPTITP